MSDREPQRVQKLTPGERQAYMAGYAAGVKDGAERSDQWASNRHGKDDGDSVFMWVMKLLPASWDVLTLRNSDLRKVS